MSASPLSQTLLPSALGARVMERLETLCHFSAEGSSRLTRLYLTPEHRAAADQVALWMTEAGLSVSMDATGTVIGRLESAMPGAKTLLLGSHLDTVRNAGKYDGNLGVILAIEAVADLVKAGIKLPYAIEILAFGDEEGVRFPVTLTSSRAVAGIFDPATLDYRDSEGISLREALIQFGCQLDQIPAIARQRSDILGYLEVHIEQGPVLEDAQLPVGVVTAISGATRLAVSVTGFAGHAGTVPMTLRRDAGAAAAEMVLAVEQIARSHNAIVATVGRMSFEPGAVNVIPSGASFTLDLRSPQDQARKTALQEIQHRFDEIAKARGVRVELKSFYNEEAALCDRRLINALDEAILAHQIHPLHLPSGAGHDGLAMQALCPFAMMFVRCLGGISHNPAESITEQDADLATRILSRVLSTLDPHMFDHSHQET